MTAAVQPESRGMGGALKSKGPTHGIRGPAGPSEGNFLGAQENKGRKLRSIKA